MQRRIEIYTGFIRINIETLLDGCGAQVALNIAHNADTS